MVFSQITLALSIMLVAGIISVLIGAVGRRSINRLTALSAIIFFIVLPLVMFYLYTILEVYVEVQDWPFNAGSFLSLWNPATAIFLVSGISGLLGMFAGKYWGEDDDRSCLQCLLGPFIIVLAISIVILFLP